MGGDPVRYYPDDVFRFGDEVTPTEKLVLIALAAYGERIHPGQDSLAKRTGFHQDTVSRAVASLRRKGFVTTSGTGKSLTYELHLRRKSGGTSGAKSEDLRRKSGGPPAQDRRDPNTEVNTEPNPVPADAGRAGGRNPFDGIDPEIVIRVRRWHPRMTDGQIDELAVAQREGLAKRLAKFGRKDVRGWWKALVERWSRTGVPPYDALSGLIDELGADVRDPAALLAFRLGIGRVAA
jgi:hypothetical protein